VNLKVHEAGVAHALALISAGAIDRLSDWPVDASPSDLTHFLALTDDDPAKGHFAFVNDGKVYRSALLSAEIDSDDAVSKAAAALIQKIDASMASNVESLRPKAKRRGTPDATPRNWYRMVVGAAQEEAELFIFDQIGEDWWSGGGVTAKKFVAELNALPSSVKSIKLHINSPGGDVFDAIAIANALRQHSASIDVVIDGLCASAATIVSCAGDTIRMADNALFMVHNPFSIVYGSASEMRSTADALDQIRDAIVATYRWVSKLSAKSLVSLMDAETWMSADEALKNGFTTETVTGLKAAASVGVAAAKDLNVPDKFRARV
jgi:ATP-dependent protease ClpP protease subunit